MSALWLASRALCMTFSGALKQASTAVRSITGYTASFGVCHTPTASPQSGDILLGMLHRYSGHSGMGLRQL